MPELPEVETVRRDLERLNGLIIKNAVLSPGWKRIYPSAEISEKRLLGRAFCGAARRGKYLSLYLDDESCLKVHLGMTGVLVYAAAAPPSPHTHMRLVLSDGNELSFTDARRFGRVWVLSGGEENISGEERLGIEPLSREFNAIRLAALLKGRKIAVKSVLLNQSLIAGLGNIYTDESLFLSGIMPDRPAGSLSPDEYAALAAAIPRVLLAAINRRGTTFSNYRDGLGGKGDNVHYLMVYGKRGEPCAVCQTPILYTKLGGRGTCYCPVCQK